MGSFTRVSPSAGKQQCYRLSTCPLLTSRNASQLIRHDFSAIVIEQRLLTNTSTGLVPLLPDTLRQRFASRVETILQEERLQWLESEVCFHSSGTYKHTTMPVIHDSLHQAQAALWYFSRHAGLDTKWANICCF